MNALMLVAVWGLVAVQPPVALKEDLTELVHGNNAFALDLYGRLASRDGNLFFSPYSISNALAMTAIGARGQTAAEMVKTLRLPFEDGRLHTTFGEVVRQLNGNGVSRKYQLAVANALWAQQGLPVRQEFLQVARNDYEGSLRLVDFARAAEAARLTINRWVEGRTNDKIKDLLQEGAIDASTRLVLTNAIYFKGSWLKPFETKQTQKGAVFHRADGSTVKIDMMNVTGEFGYAEAEGVQALQLPYAGKEVSMVVVLPKDAGGLPGLEKSLTPAILTDWIARMRTSRVIASLPRFKATSQFRLKETLEQLGMKTAFSSEADLSGITGQRDLVISDVIHKAFVDVNEEGTEAAAATAVVIARTAAPLRPLTFKADHPFVFLIRDNRTGSILFLGRLSDPTK